MIKIKVEIITCDFKEKTILLKVLDDKFEVVAGEYILQEVTSNE